MNGSYQHTVGAGEEYVRAYFRQIKGESSNTVGGEDSARDRELEEALSEQIARLNAVAVYLMKRNFSRIRSPNDISSALLCDT